MRLAFESVDSVKGMNRTKSGRKRSLTLFSALLLELEHLISSSPALRLGFTPMAPLGLRPSDLD